MLRSLTQESSAVLQSPFDLRLRATMKTWAFPRIVRCMAHGGLVMTLMSACSPSSGGETKSDSSSSANASNEMEAQRPVGPKRDVRGVRIGMTLSEVRGILPCEEQQVLHMRDVPSEYEESGVLCARSNDSIIRVIFSSRMAGEGVMEVSNETTYPGKLYADFVQLVRNDYDLGNNDYQQGEYNGITFGWRLDNSNIGLEAYCQKYCKVTIYNRALRNELTRKSAELWATRQPARPQF